MKDLLGNEIQIGDRIAFCLPRPDRKLGLSKDALTVGTIEGFTEKGLRAIYDDSRQYRPTPRQRDGLSVKHLYDGEFIKT